MATINEISNAAGYLGSAQLGGANTGVVGIDMRPIQQLAQYTYLYNKNLFDQRQKDADEKIAELAKLTAYDLANARGKDKDAGIKALADLQKFGAEFAAKGTPKTPQEKIQQQIEYQSKIQGAENIINSINARGIGYTARKNNILASNVDAGLKDTQLKQLDEEFDNTDIYTKIGAEPKFDLTIPKIGAPIIKKTGVLVETPNGVVDQTLGFFDPMSNMNASFLEANNLELPTLPANATPLEKQEYEQKLKVKSNNKIWQDAATVYNTALSDPKYQSPLPSNELNQTGINFNAIEANNPILSNTIQLIDRYNTYATERRADAEAGFYTDKLGNRVKLLQTVKPEDFFIIDKAKPLSPAQVVFLQKFADAAPDTKDEKFQYTGDAIKLQIERMQQAGQDRRNNADNTNARYIAELGKLNKSGTVTDKEEYPIRKTQELVDIIGINQPPKNYIDLTPEQQSKIKQQVGGQITDLTKATVSIRDGVIKVDGSTTKDKVDTKVSITIAPDDITKRYFDEINLNDAGKEAPQRKYFTISQTETVSPSGNVIQLSETDVFTIDGKQYTKKQLNDIGYADAKIQEAISLGRVKKK